MNLAARFRAEGLLPLNALGGELVSLVILAFVGYIFVEMHKEKTMLKAFFLGVSAPALIINSAQVIDSPSGASSALGLALMQPLHAASQSSSSETRTLTVEVDADGNFRDSGRIFIVESGTEREVEAGDDGWKVPTTEFSLVFRGTLDGVPVETPVAVVGAGSAPIVLSLDVEQTFWGGVLDGFGFDNWAQRFVRSEATIEELPDRPLHAGREDDK